jgi:hypothetical protein
VGGVGPEFDGWVWDLGSPDVYGVATVMHGAAAGKGGVHRHPQFSELSAGEAFGQRKFHRVVLGGL